MSSSVLEAERKGTTIRTVTERNEMGIENGTKTRRKRKRNETVTERKRNGNGTETKCRLSVNDPIVERSFDEDGT